MPWPRHESDPLKARRRQLADQERHWPSGCRNSRANSRAGRRRRGSGQESGRAPVWRMEEDGAAPKVPEAAAPRPRGLGRQRQRDMVIFFLCTAALLAIMGIVFYLWKTHVDGG